MLYFAAILVAIWSIYLSCHVQSTFKKWSKEPTSRYMTGAEVARQILMRNGITDVPISVTPGVLTDHYDPTRKALFLSDDVANSSSIGAVAVAAHECGHAIQHNQDYGFLIFRNKMVPVANIGSSAGIWLCILGLFLGGIGGYLVPIGIGLFAFAVLFHVITLPVEFNASRRAMINLEEGGFLMADETRGAKKVLKAAAMTYVAAALASVIQLLRLIGISRD